MNATIGLLSTQHQQVLARLAAVEADLARNATLDLGEFVTYLQSEVGDHFTLEEEALFPIVARHVERVVLVSDDAIQQAQAAVWSTLRVVVEPGGAAAFAALLSGRYVPPPGEHVGVLLSGGNTVAVNFSV